MSTDQEFWDSRYREGDLPWNTEKPSTELVKTLESGRISKGRALELGCGYGTNALYLAEQGFDVTALDISPAAIEEARRRAEAQGLNIEFQVADLTGDANPGGPYDFLFDRGVYHGVRRDDLNAFLKLLERASRPGTYYLSLTGNANEPGEHGPPKVSEEEIRSELGSLFDIIDLHEFRFDESPQMPHRPLGWSVLMRRKG